MSEKKKKRETILNLDMLTERIRSIGKDLDNVPISLERGRHVSGSISTGSLTMDLMLGGGVPPARWSTFWGPSGSGKTTAGLSTIAQAQRARVPTVLFDHESAMDVQYATNLGIRTNDPKDKAKQNPYFNYTIPTTGDQTYRHILRILTDLPDYEGEGKGRPKPSILFVIDSLAAMSPEVLVEDDEKSPMAAAGRMHSDYMRRIKAILGKKNGAIVAINQTRTKPGFCFDYSTRVVLADGTTERISVIVKNRLKVEVMSFDPATGKVEPRKVVGWFRNGYADHFLSFKTENASGLNGYTDWACTPDHDIFTPEGERKARDIKVGDMVWGRAQFVLNKLQRSVAYGSILGDGCLGHQSTHKIALRIAHGQEQLAYMEWKRELFGELSSDVFQNSPGISAFTVQPSADLLDVYDEAYPAPGQRGIPSKLLKKLDLRAIAIWYMDDGTFVEPKKGWSKNGRSSISCVWLSDEDARRLSKKLVKLGLPKPILYTYFHKKSGKTIKRLNWNGANSRAFQEKLAPYIHPSMEYKIHADLRGNFEPVPAQKPHRREKMVPTQVVAIHKKPKGKYPHMMEKFDLEVEGHHTYMVGSGGVGVHNSMGDPTYEPGGEAVIFYPDVKLFMRAVQKPFNERGREMRLVNLYTNKNKVFPPFKRENERLAIAFGRGYERFYDGIGWIDMMGFMEKSGGGDNTKYVIKMGDKFIDGTRRKPEMVELLHTEKFRTFATRYMESGQAFKDYCRNSGTDFNASINPEDAGLDYDERMKSDKKDKLKKLEAKVKDRDSKSEKSSKSTKAHKSSKRK